MIFTPDEEEIISMSIGPRQRPNGNVYFPEEYVTIIRKRAQSIKEQFPIQENAGRDATIDALYLASKAMETLAPDLSKLIFALAVDLLDLNHGQVADIFTKCPVPNRPPTPKLKEVTKAQIIVAMQLYFLANKDKVRSAKWAYQKVKNWSLPTNKTAFNYRTLINWRKAAMEGSAEDLLTETYNLFLNDALQECGNDKEKLEERAIEMLIMPPLFGSNEKK